MKRVLIVALVVLLVVTGIPFLVPSAASTSHDWCGPTSCPLHHPAAAGLVAALLVAVVLVLERLSPGRPVVWQRSRASRFDRPPQLAHPF